MSRTLLVLAASFALALPTGCSVDNDPRDLTYEMRLLEQTDGPCGEGGDDSCGSVTLAYPEFVEAGAPGTAGRLNAAIAEMLLKPMFSEHPAESPAVLMEGFLAEWTHAHLEFPDAASTQAWNLNRHIRVVFEGPGTLTVAFEQIAYTGGAHGMHVKSYASFDPLDGKRLRLADILDDGYEARLATLAEQSFREARGLSPDADLTEAGFWLEERSLVPEENFGVVEDGIVFRFDAYDIAPYSMGPTEFTVTRKNLGHLVR